MNDTQLKDYLRKLLSPILDNLVESSLKLTHAIYESFPKDMPDDDKLKYLESIFKSQREAIIVSMNAMVPDDIAKKVKEEINNGK